jgi:replicative superfamily II helicase
MADKVIVVGVKRGNERVSSSEIMQMIGRAGRKHDGGTCQAEIIVESDCYSDVESEMVSDTSFDVKSHIGSPEWLAFHVLPDICENLVTTPEKMQEWYSKTLGAFQGQKGYFDQAIALLRASEAILDTPEGFVATSLGKIASRLYFNPADVKAWKDNFSIVFETCLETDDLAIAWALGNVPITRMAGDFGKHWEVVSDCKGNIPPGLEIMEGSTTTIVLWWSAIGGPSVGKMRNQMLNLRDDFGRIHKALIELDKEVAHWEREDYFNELKQRVAKGIPSFLSDLCKIPGITKSRADYLYNAGVRDRSDIVEMADSLEGEVDSSFLEVLKAVANGLR